MDNVRKQIGVATAGDTLEEVSRFNANAIKQSTRPDQCCRIGNNMRQVKEDTARLGIAVEDRGK
jgi:hypothetical protein